MNPTVLSLDTRDDRREIWGLLHRLSPSDRLVYLEKCCRACADANGNGLFPLPSFRGMVRDAQRSDRGDDGLTNAIYADLVQLAHQEPLDLGAVARDLEGIAKGRAPVQPAALRSALRAV